MSHQEIQQLEEHTVEAIDYYRGILLDLWEQKLGGSSHWDDHRNRVLKALGDRGLQGRIRVIMKSFRKSHSSVGTTTPKSSSSTKTKKSQQATKEQKVNEIVEKVKICFECEGSTNPGGPCYSGPGGARSIHPGGMCYSGPGGNLSLSPGGSMYAGPGGNRYAGPGGNCYAGPGGACAKGTKSDSCPKICGLDPSTVR